MGIWMWIVLIVVGVVGYLLWNQWKASLAADIEAVDASLGDYFAEAAEREMETAVSSVASSLDASATDADIRGALTTWFDTNGRFRPSNEQSMNYTIDLVRERLSPRV